MSIGAILNNSYSGLAASQAALRTISHNIANVNTPGFARLQTQLASVTSSGAGAGVRVAEITRATDRFLEQHALGATSELARAKLSADFQQRLQSLIGDPSSQTGIAGRLDTLRTALAALAQNPADLTHARAAVGQVQGVFDETDRLTSDIAALRSDASTQLAATTQSINGLLERVRVLNGQVVRAQLTRADESGAAEQRAQALGQLAELVDISTVEQADGSLHVLTRTGQTLLDSAARQLDYASPGAVGSDVNATAIRISTVNPQTGVAVQTSAVLDAEASGGRVRALIDVRDKDLAGAQAGLGELARVLANELNRAHNANSAAPAPATLIGRPTGLAGTERAGFTGKTTFAVVDSQGVLLTKATIDFAALGPAASLGDVVAAINTGLNGAATAQFTGGVFTLQSSIAGAGVAVVEVPGAAGARAGQGFSQFFGLNDLVRGARPTNVDTGLQLGDAHQFAAGGTLELDVRDSANRRIAHQSLTIAGATMGDILATLNAPGGAGDALQFALDANGRLLATPRADVSGVTLRVVSDSTSRAGTGVTFSDFFGLGADVQASAGRGLKVRADILANAGNLATSRVDAAAISGSFVLGRGDYRGADALRDVLDVPARFNAAGTLAAASAKISTYAGTLLGETAVRAAEATQTATDAASLAASATSQRDGALGVNLDEELANLLVFQTSYNASARMMSAAKDLYDALLGILN